MAIENRLKIRTRKNDLILRVSKGHFATAQSHTNYYIDIATQKSCLGEAKAVAEALYTFYHANTIVNAILCLDGTEVIGTCLADALTRENFVSLNSQQTIYILTPEFTATRQLLFRDNTAPMIVGKNVLVLAASVRSGQTAKAAIDAIRYYGGTVAGIAAIFSTIHSCEDVPVHSVFDPGDLPDYVSCPSHNCPLCQKGEKLDALINNYGFSSL